jgi:lipoprotein-anchoring transpeptidase ErfK/SrfK
VLSAPSTLSVITAALAVVIALSTHPATAAPAARPVVVQATQTLAILLYSQAAMSAPDPRSTVMQLVDARRSVTGERTVLPVIGRASGVEGVEWLHVLLPGRPNGHTGWVRRQATDPARTIWHIVVDTSERRVTVYKQGHPVRVFKAVVGKPATPTPSGRFFVEEAVRMREDDIGAPFALALSARSYVLQEFNGGPGQIALHGRTNVGGILGTAVSHGCIRLETSAIRWLVYRIGPGAPVTITN